MRRHPFAFPRSLIAVLLLVLPTVAQTAESVDEAAIKILREHGLEKSEVMETLSWLCDVYGPRLTASPNLRQASEWALGRFTAWGLSDPRLEAWGPFGKSWRLDRVAVHVVGDNPWPVLAWPKAWSPSIPGRATAEVVSVAGKTRDEVLAMDLAGKIVLMEPRRELSEHFDGDAHRFDAEELLAMANGTSTADRTERPTTRDRGDFMRQGALLGIVAGKKPLAMIDRGPKGDYGTIFVAGATLPGPEDAARGARPRVYAPNAPAAIPQFTISVEHFNRLSRLLDKGLAVRMELELETTFFDGDGMCHNVLADLPGTDPALKDQVVMFGAHLDSWHSGTGTTDNGCGSAVMIEAMRLLRVLVKESGKSPRRTIRVALWTGEEQGLLGSRAYVNRHFAVSGERGQPPKELLPDHAKLAAYFNLDNGTGKVRGVYLQGNEAVAGIFRAWLRPFHDLGASTLTLNNTGGTDHLSFDGVGLPGFQFIQDPVAYSPRTHHSNMDVVDHAVADDLKQAATIVAAFAWHAAMRDEPLPRKPFPAPRPADPPSRDGPPAPSRGG